MAKEIHSVFTAHDRSYLAILKKDIRELILPTGLSPKRKAEIDIVVAEIASNLVKHGRGGEILVRVYEEPDNEIVELISIDDGPGIQDLTKVMADGVSTTNTLGHGLGSIKRLSDFFQVYSMKDWGTILLSRVYKNKPAPFKKPLPAEVHSIVVAKPGEEECGDGYHVKLTSRDLRVFIGDGLGHGPDAQKAVSEAIRAFRLSVEPSPADIIRDIHRAVKRTRGLVGTVAIYNFKESKWLFCGVGNILCRTHNTLLSKNILPYNGIIGLNIPSTMKDQELANDRGSILIMCSDGIKSRLEFHKYTAILKYDLSILAAALYKDYARKTDDMSVVVSRIN